MSSRYTNRELSLLDFQERVLAVAENPSVPLLERVKFVAIVASNLDEFFQVRVAGLREQVAAGVSEVTGAAGPSALLASIRRRCLALACRTERLVAEQLTPGLAEHGIYLAAWEDLDEEERDATYQVFERDIYPMLTPLGFDPAHPFPFISNLSMNLAVILHDPVADESRFARVKVPPLLPRFLAVGAQSRLVPTEQVIAAHLPTLFPGMDIVSHHAFRVTRSAEQEVAEAEAYDLLEAMREMLHTRHRFSRVVRLEIQAGMPAEVLDLLTGQLGLDESGVYEAKGLLALAGLFALHTLDRPELKDPQFSPTTQPALADPEAGSIFERIRRRDLLVHLPYESFGTSVGAFIAEASVDPDVVAIKQTLYRTWSPEDPAAGGEASVVQSLMRAGREGKQVAVLVELKARFDEEANITWARLLEEAGVHVVYGVAGLKTHAKIALVVRREGGRLVRYSHIGTGNYNPYTARLYDDLGLLTADEDIGADLSELFNVLTGYSGRQHYRRLLVAPTHLRRQVIDLIRSQANPGGRIVLKLNHLVDSEIVDELYAAAAAGADIDLIVRGQCCLRPGVDGLAERVRVRSLVGKYLEHSRIMRFGEGPEAAYFIGSADMMPRNLNRRVEVMTPITDSSLCLRLEEVLRVCLADDTLAWGLEPDGTWAKVPTNRGVNTHRRLEALAVERARGTGPDPVRAAAPTGVVLAAGGLITRRTGNGKPEILVVHRPRYDDWSFPKGKAGDGEGPQEAARREVLEETGYECTVGPEIATLDYPDRLGNRKMVRYWAMTVGAGEFAPNNEVDEVRWLPPEGALHLLTYDRDRALLRSYLTKRNRKARR
ncbi:MAG: polyphosphate kinase 1 [Acidimicrobiia bacterium]|nr:polyphosphate kinase 1 [Acidimicrobiia bacterium]